MNRYRQEEFKLLEINENEVIEVFEWLFQDSRLVRELNKYMKTKSIGNLISSETSSDMEELFEEEQKMRKKERIEKNKKGAQKKILYSGL